MHNSKPDVTGTCCTAVCDSIGLEGAATLVGLDLYQGSVSGNHKSDAFVLS